MPKISATIPPLMLPILIGGLFLCASVAQAQTAEDKFPRLSNNFMHAGIGIKSRDVEPLSKYDLVVLPAEAQIFNPTLASELRKRNPDIILLAYIPTKSFAMVWSENPNDTLHQKLLAGIQDDWRLRSGNGSQLSVWPRTWSLNINSGYAEWLPQFVSDHIMSSGYWDGIFYDESSATISWLNGGDLDLNGDSQRDSASEADRLWKAGMIRMLTKTRQLIGNSPIIVINGDSDGDLAGYVNGRMFETFPTPWEYDGTWQTVTGNYLRLQDQIKSPPAFIVNSNTENTGNQNDFRKMRFGLTTTLLGDGYFGFDFGDQDHGQLWWYDEYEAFLGRPLGDAVNLTGSSGKIIPGLWKREFENGIVLVNSTDAQQTANLDGEFERIHGIQDPNTNNGEISSIVDVPAKDGLILLRPLEDVVGASFQNGAFTRILNNSGEAKRTGFFAYTNTQRGGATVATYDSTSYGNDTSLVAKGNRIEAYNRFGSLVRTITPFGSSWNKGVEFSIGEAGGKTYIAVGAGAGDKPLVRLYDANLNPVTEAFLAYDSRFNGGISPGVGDFNGDGSPDIVTGAGAGGGPHVRIFNTKQEVMGQWFAYHPRFNGGVHIGVGDVDGDGVSEIVTGAGFGGGPHVRVFNLYGEVENQFFAYDSRKRSGVRISVGDLDNDGRAEILAMTNDVFTLAFNPLSLF